MKPLAERALEQLVLGNMNADAEWLVQNSPTSFSYWMNTLETRIDSETNQDRSVKLRAQTLLAHSIQDPKLAEHICAALNLYAISWTFAYDYEDKSIKALSSLNIYVHEVDEPYAGVLEPSVFQDAWMILLCQSIWGQATLAGELADVVAELAGGVAAHSKPANRDQIREVADVFSLLPDVLHQRPEWLRDYRPYTQWPPTGDWAAVLKQSILDEFDLGHDVDLTEAQGSSVLDIKFSGQQISQWVLARVEDDRYGVCMFSRQEFPRIPLYSDAEVANRANLLMFIHPNFSQFGSWVANQNSMYYASLIPSAFIRSLEDSAAKNALFNYNPAFFARLALRSRNSFDCLYSLLEEDKSESNSSDSFDYSPISQRLEQTLQASARQALDVTNSIEETADPTLLRLKSSFQFFVIGVFNPMGPTVQSLEAFPTETDNEYTIAEIQRHPLYPSYLPMARVQAGSPEFSRALEAAVEKHFNWLPSYLDLAACPEEVLPEVTALIKRRLLQVAIEQKIDVAEYTSRLETLRDDAWSRVDHSLPDIEEATTPATAIEIERHFELITSPENLALFWNSIPDAWDGSLNFSLGNGSLNQTNIGPLLWTYNRAIGAAE